MEKRNTKVMIVWGVVIVLVVGLFIYFRPLSLSGLLPDNPTILVCQSVVGIKDGEAYIAQSSEHITEQQKNEMVQLFDEYAYRRKFGTVFSDGAFESNGDVTYLYVYIYDGAALENTVVFTDGGEIAVNSRNYRLKKSKDVVQKMQEILGK